jgi:hypothetical protein
MHNLFPFCMSILKTFASFARFLYFSDRFVSAFPAVYTVTFIAAHPATGRICGPLRVLVCALFATMLDGSRAMLLMRIFPFASSKDGACYIGQ